MVVLVVHRPREVAAPGGEAQDQRAVPRFCVEVGDLVDKCLYIKSRLTVKFDGQGVGDALELNRRTGV